MSFNQSSYKKQTFNFCPYFIFTDRAVLNLGQFIGLKVHFLEYQTGRSAVHIFETVTLRIPNI